MRARDVVIPGVYVARVSNKLCRIKVTGVSCYGGYDAINLETGRKIHLRTAGRLRYKAKESQEA